MIQRELIYGQPLLPLSNYGDFMDLFLLFCATLTATSKILVCKKIGRDTSGKSGVFLHNGALFAIGAFVILATLLTDIRSVFEISSYSFVLALLFAVFLLSKQAAEILALKFGAVSMTELVLSCGFLVPIFYGCFFLGESISPLQIGGLCVLIAALVMIISPKKSERLCIGWLVLAVLSALSSGINAVIQKIHQASEYDFELMPFLFFSLLFCAVFSFIAAFLTRGRTKPVKSASFSKGYLVFLLVFGGLCVGILNILNLRLAGKLPAVVQFPIYSIGTMILTGLAGKFIYKETIGTRKLIGFIIGCIAITVIAIF